MSERFLVLIGPTRTGTTSLFRYLARDHENFSASGVKETNFFLPAGGPSTARAVERSEYLRLFSAPTEARIRLEASPLYFAAATHVTEAIRSALPGDDVRVLATLREPLDRFVSLYRHVVTKRNAHEAPMPFDLFSETALSARGSLGLATLADANMHAFNEGRYAELLGAWSAALGTEQVRAVSFEALADDQLRVGVLDELYEWLGLDNRDHLRTPYLVENRSRPVHARGVHELALKLNDRLEPLLNRAPWLRNLARTAYYAANEDKTSREELPPYVLQALRDAYGEVNSDLANVWHPKLLGALPTWCSER